MLNQLEIYWKRFVAGSVEETRGFDEMTALTVEERNYFDVEGIGSAGEVWQRFQWHYVKCHWYNSYNKIISRDAE
ncbi:MAG: hypothetical protein GY757_29560 [bacterium]|nr:hypothetical protein [bacterium]